jgi:hypothetical protein
MLQRLWTTANSARLLIPNNCHPHLLNSEYTVLVLQDYAALAKANWELWASKSALFFVHTLLSAAGAAPPDACLCRSTISLKASSITTSWRAGRSPVSALALITQNTSPSEDANDAPASLIPLDLSVIAPLLLEVTCSELTTNTRERVTWHNFSAASTHEAATI